jgi:hypothetical protein
VGVFEGSVDPCAVSEVKMITLHTGQGSKFALVEQKAVSWRLSLMTQELTLKEGVT